MNSMHYWGLDVHKKTISYCLRQADGSIVAEGTIAATRDAINRGVIIDHEAPVERRFVAVEK